MKSIWLTVCVLPAAAGLWLPGTCPGEPGETASPIADRLLGTAPGEVRDDNTLKMQFVWCPPGRFQMEQVEAGQEMAAPGAAASVTVAEGDDDAVVDAPQSDVTVRTTTTVTPVKVFLKHGYWLGRYEVTRAEWKQVMSDADVKWPVADDIPATQIGWNEAMEFCRRLTEREREAERIPATWEYTLPTEAQWERACRARTATVYGFGNDESKLVDYAWFDKNASDAGEPHPHRVGLKRPNAWGLYDMHGNVWEWCRDIFVDRLPGGFDPLVTAGGTARVIRGASWRGSAVGCRSSHRSIYQASPQGNEVGGFRVALCRVTPVAANAGPISGP